MFDLHCHLLPGVDDGAPDLATALAMARRAVAEGIVQSVVTPHTYDGSYEVPAEAAAQALTALRAALAAEAIPLELRLGAENRLDARLLEAARDGAARTLGGSSWVLVELPPRLIPPRLEESLFALRAAGLRPLLAHPERYPGLRGRPGRARLRQLRQAGTALQLTADAFTGSPERARRARGLLREGLCDVIASDAHAVERRPPALREARAEVARLAGEEVAARLFEENPQRVLADRSLLPVEPLPRPWWRRWLGVGG